LPAIAIAVASMLIWSSGRRSAIRSASKLGGISTTKTKSPRSIARSSSRAATSTGGLNKGGWIAARKRRDRSDRSSSTQPTAASPTSSLAPVATE